MLVNYLIYPIFFGIFSQLDYRKKTRPSSLEAGRPIVFGSGAAREGGEKFHPISDAGGLVSNPVIKHCNLSLDNIQ